MQTRIYGTPIAFKTAVEQRLKNMIAEGRDLERRRQLVVFDRFLARIVTEFGDAVVLKGGLALELRLERARTTKDIDLRMSGDANQLLSRLQQAGRLELGDFMGFEVGHHRHATIQGDGVRYDGVRFRVECKLAGRLYGRPFGLDVGIGDPMTVQTRVLRTCRTSRCSLKSAHWRRHEYLPRSSRHSVFGGLIRSPINCLNPRASGRLLTPRWRESSSFAGRRSSHATSARPDFSIRSSAEHEARHGIRIRGLGSAPDQACGRARPISPSRSTPVGSVP
jgi:hypothetical protein